MKFYIVRVKKIIRAPYFYHVRNYVPECVSTLSEFEFKHSSSAPIQEEDEEKKEMKTIVKKMWSEMENGSLITTMLDITCNGNDLIQKENMVDSPECLKLLLDFYED